MVRCTRRVALHGDEWHRPSIITGADHEIVMQKTLFTIS